MKKCSVAVNHIVENGRHRYIMRHNLGKNWSLYNKAILESILKEFSSRPFKIEIHNDTILMFEIQK
jgi:hypothetical protein